MVNTNGLAIFVLTAGMSVCTTEQARAERSIFGKKISKNDQIRVQQARLNRLEERIEKMSSDGAFLVERARQHRDMRVKGTAELRQKVLDLKVKLQEDRERMQKEFEEKLMAVREEMWAQAARDRDALEAELGARHEGERERLLEEAQERTNAMVEEVKAKMSAEAERDRELYARRAALAEEGQELARKDRKQLQEEKDELARQLEEAMTVEDANRKKIILKFKSRENTLRRNFQDQLLEARAAATTGVAARAPNAVSKRPRAVSTATASTSTSSSNGVRGEGSKRAAVESASSAMPSNSGAAAATSVSNACPAKTPQR